MMILYYIFLIVFYCHVAYVDAATLNVNSTGSDSNTYAQVSAGTHAWNTIQRAAWGSTNRSSTNSGEAAQAGDTVLIAAGTYSVAGTSDRYSPAYKTVNSGSSGNPITFLAAGTVTLQLSSGTGPLIGVSKYDVDISGTHNYVTWNGFTILEINAPGQASSGAALVVGGTGNRIENCVLTGNPNRAGLSSDSNHDAIWIEEDTGTVIKNNTISYWINGTSYHHNAAGVMSYGSTNLTVEHNYFHHCGSSVFLKGGSSSGAIIRFNDCLAAAIDTAHVSGTTKVYQNIVRSAYGSEGVGSRQHIKLAPTAENSIAGTVYIVNNTLVDGFINQGDTGMAPTVYIANNIMGYFTEDSYYAIQLAYDEMTTWYLDYNVYYNGSPWWSYPSVSNASIAAWRTSLGGSGDWNDNNSITSDPLFVGSGSYKLQGGSPASALGVDILDLDGDSSTVDNIPSGAYVTGSETIGIESASSVLSMRGITSSGVTIH